MALAVPHVQPYVCLSGLAPTVGWYRKLCRERTRSSVFFDHGFTESFLLTPISLLHCTSSCVLVFPVSFLIVYVILLY